MAKIKVLNLFIPRILHDGCIVSGMINGSKISKIAIGYNIICADSAYKLSLTGHKIRQSDFRFLPRKVSKKLCGQNIIISLRKCLFNGLM